LVVQSAAQQARMAVKNSVSLSMPKKLSNWPAKLAPARSSINAEERTTQKPGSATRPSRQIVNSGSTISAAIGC
jgi:hypothetical protein